MKRFHKAGWSAGLVAVCVLLSACTAQEEAPERPLEPVAYVTVEPEDYSDTVALTGEIVARHTATYSFKTSGRVTDVFVDVGSEVEPRTALARLDPTQQEASVAAAEAALQSANARLRQATATYERQEQLLAKGFTTQGEFDSAENALSAARSAVSTAEADLSTARTNLEETTLRADAAGVITSRSVDPGQVVSAAQTAFGFARQGGRDAVFDIQAQLLIPDKQPETVEVALVGNPGVTAEGRIREVSPLIDTATGTVEVKVGLEDTPPDMTLGSAVVGRASGMTPKRAIFVPWQALMAKNGRPSVWIVGDDGAASLTTVEIGGYQTGRIRIASGLEAGDRVITRGSQIVRPGQVVALLDPSDPAAEDPLTQDSSDEGASMPDASKEEAAQ